METPTSVSPRLLKKIEQQMWWGDARPVDEVLDNAAAILKVVVEALHRNAGAMNFEDAEIIDEQANNVAHVLERINQEIDNFFDETEDWDEESEDTAKRLALDD
jgi:hypothetical protein